MKEKDERPFSISPEEMKIQRFLRIKNEKDDFHPLLDRLLPKLKGIESKDYTHGANEHGADFVLSKKDQTTGLPGYIGVVAKCGNVNKPDSHRIIDQVRECHGERYFLGGKQKIYLSEVWVTTTGIIAPAARQNIHEAFKASNVVFIDRDILISWIDAHLPRYWTDIDVVLSDFFTQTIAKLDREEKDFSLLIGEEQPIYIEHDIIRFDEKRKPLKLFRKLPKPRVVSILDEIKNHKFIIIEGEAGSGKSRFARELIKQLCNGALFHDARLIPLKISARELLEEYKGDLSNFISAQLKNFKQLLDDEENSFLVIADGLDEINPNAKEISDKIESLSTQLKSCPRARLMTLSRAFASEFDDDVNTHDAYQLQISPFSLTKTIKFLKALCKKIRPSDRVFEDLKKSALFSQLPKSPMAAILLARILNEDVKDLPSTLPELYRKYCQLAMGEWDIDRGLMAQKEADALNKILTEIAKYFIENQLEEIGIKEASDFFQRYLKTRNTGLTESHLFNNVANRCAILRINRQTGTFAFKHRTFIEFLYAKGVYEQNILKSHLNNPTSEVFSSQWSTTLYFYIGLLRDCPDYLKSIIEQPTQTPVEEAIKVTSLPDLLLSAYNTNYEVIKLGITSSAIGLADFYLRLTKDPKFITRFQSFSQIALAVMFSARFAQSFSYDFFKDGIPEVAHTIALKDLPNDLKCYAIYFLSNAYRDLGGIDSFDFLLTDDLKPIPFALQFMIYVEAKDEKHRSKLLRRHEKHVSDSLKQNGKLRRELNLLLNRPITSILNPDSKKPLLKEE